MSCMQKQNIQSEMSHISIKYTQDSLASYPGSLRVQTKNQKERGEPGKVYHVRNERRELNYKWAKE